MKQKFDDFLEEYLAENEDVRAEYEKQKEQIKKEISEDYSGG